MIPKKSPHAGILAAAAHHPTWVKAMDGQTVPYVWAAGYECGNPASPFVPFVDFYQHGGQISLDQHCVDDRGRDDAVPAFAGE